jgi:hypothetical protein
MEALFFSSLPDEATGVTSSHDLPGDLIAEALRIEDPSPLAGLARLLGVDRPPRPLRDATCRSFPVWALGPDLSTRLGSLGDDEIDDLAERWQKHDESSLDADLYELAGCLADLREAVRRLEPAESVFVLLEERAW